MTVQLPVRTHWLYAFRFLLTSPSFLTIVPLAQTSTLMFQVEAHCGKWGGLAFFICLMAAIFLLAIHPHRKYTPDTLKLTIKDCGLLVESEACTSFHPWEQVTRAERDGDTLWLTCDSTPWKLSIKHLSPENKALLTTRLHTRAGKTASAAPLPPPTGLSHIPPVAGNSNPRAAAYHAERSAANRTGRRYAMLALVLILASYCLQQWNPAVPHMHSGVVFAFAGLLSLYLLLPHPRRRYILPADVRCDGHKVLVQYHHNSWLLMPTDSLYNACKHRYGVYYDTCFAPCGLALESPLPNAPEHGHCHPRRNSIMLMLLAYALAWAILLWIQEDKGYRLYIGGISYALKDSTQPEASQEQIRGALALIIQEHSIILSEIDADQTKEAKLSVQRTPRGNYLFTIHQDAPVKLLVSPNGFLKGAECMGNSTFWRVNGGASEDDS